MIYRAENIKDFDPVHVFECGQCFRWNDEGDGSYTGVAGGRAVSVSFEEGRLTLDNCTENDFEEFWKDYFDLKRDYGEVMAELSGHDEVMARAVKYGHGIRILQQDPWEALISFIISQNSNIPRIKKCIESLCSCFGESLGIYKGKERFAFPPAEKLAGLSVSDLKECRLGYRDEYIIRTAQAVASDGGRELYRMTGAPTAEAEAYIRSLHGVGPKVAGCILLFGLGKYDSFPIDVWMKRIMHRLYGFEEKDLKGMAAYADKNFGKLSGFAQQYLFYYARENL